MFCRQKSAMTLLFICFDFFSIYKDDSGGSWTFSFGLGKSGNILCLKTLKFKNYTVKILFPSFFFQFFVNCLYLTNNYAEKRGKTYKRKKIAQSWIRTKTILICNLRIRHWILRLCGEKPYQHDDHADKDSHRHDGHADKDLYKWLNGRATATSLIDPGADLWCGDKTHTAVIPIILAQKQNPCTQSARSLRVRCKGKNLLHFLTPHRTVCGGGGRGLQITAWCINSTI